MRIRQQKLISHPVQTKIRLLPGEALLSPLLGASLATWTFRPSVTPLRDHDQIRAVYIAQEN